MKESAKQSTKESTKESTKKNTDFAGSLAELEKVVAELDSDVPIEKALVLFEQGMQLSNECEKFLTAAEQKVEILKRTASGLSVETFALENTSLDSSID